MRNVKDSKLLKSMEESKNRAEAEGKFFRSAAMTLLASTEAMAERSKMCVTLGTGQEFDVPTGYYNTISDNDLVAIEALRQTCLEQINAVFDHVEKEALAAYGVK